MGVPMRQGYHYIYDRRLGMEPESRELLISFPVEAMRMSPMPEHVITRQNDDAVLLNQPLSTCLGDNVARRMRVGTVSTADSAH
jgi:hypothetical protein